MGGNPKYWIAVPTRRDGIFALDENEALLFFKIYVNTSAKECTESSGRKVVINEKFVNFLVTTINLTR